MQSNLDRTERDIPKRATLVADNIGGIDRTEVSFERGVTVLSGRNATNRTSLLQAIMAALGSDQVSLKADADEGHAELELGDEIYRRTLERRNGTIVTDGDPYLDDPEVADLFAFLLEANGARRAVRRGDDLREPIMRPVDTDAIQAEITQYEARKRQIDEQLAELDDLEGRLPDLEAKRTRKTDEIETLREDLEAAKAELDETPIDVEQRRQDQSELETKLESLRDTRSDLERVRDRIETERESIEALEEEREEVEAELASLSPDDGTAVDRLEAEIDALREEKADLSEEISQLQSTIQFNERLLDESASFLEDASDPEDRETDGDLTDQLLGDSEAVTCWTCGSSVARDQVETTIEQLRSVREERLEERSEINADLEERQETLSTINENRTEHRRTRERLDSIDAEIDRRQERLEEQTEQREELTDEIQALESEIDDLETDDYAGVLDQYKEVNQLEFELERAEREREEIEAEIAEIEERLDEREGLESRRDEVTDELTSLRTRIDRIEANAVEAFNEHMENLLETLEYGNLDRIWIDRTTREVREGRRKTERSSFDLKIVRSTDDGAAYEDTIDHLSESEREVTGLVFALAGYLVHDVYETVPFMLLDSLEAIDAERIGALIEYFEDYVPYLVVALLDEDAQAVEVDHGVVSEI